MPLWPTLSRRKARGHDERTLKRLTLQLKTALGVDLGRMLKHLRSGVVGDPFEFFSETRMDIVQHVFNGILPSGVATKEAVAADFGGDREEMLFILAYMMDTDDDLLALDTIAVFLRRLLSAAAEFERFADLAYHHPPPEAEFYRAVVDLVEIVNERLAEYDIGYQFHISEFVRSPEPELFSGVVEPCLLALHRDPDLRDTEAEFAKALRAFKAGDHKQAVHHAGESLEGMLRVMVKRLRPEKHVPTLLLPASIDLLAPQKLWPHPYGEIMKKIYAVRGDRGAHSEATKPAEGRATERDASTMVYLSATMLVFLANVLAEKAAIP